MTKKVLPFKDWLSIVEAKRNAEAAEKALERLSLDKLEEEEEDHGDLFSSAPHGEPSAEPTAEPSAFIGSASKPSEPEAVYCVHLDKDTSLSVNTLKEAAKAVKSHWVKKRKASGKVAPAWKLMAKDPQAGFLERDGVVFAHISQNGQIWEGIDRDSHESVEIIISEREESK